MTDRSIPLAALTETIARAISKFPEQKGRIERAAQLIATGHVDKIAADLWAVRSQTDESVYIVDNTGCPCVDAQRHPEMTCKHCWAIDLILVTAERARRLEARATAPEAAPVVTEATMRAHLSRLIEERAARARLVYASNNRPIDDERCRLLDEQIARLRANLAPVTFRESVAA
jgi:hypothetical protein